MSQEKMKPEHSGSKATPNHPRDIADLAALLVSNLTSDKPGEEVGVNVPSSTAGRHSFSRRRRSLDRGSCFEGHTELLQQVLQKAAPSSMYVPRRGPLSSEIVRMTGKQSLQR